MSEDLEGIDVDLDDVGSGICEIDHASATAARHRLEDLDRIPRYGRLADLALWWAAVRGDENAPAPAAVRHVGVAVAAAGTAVPLPSHVTTGEALAWGLKAADDAADAGTDLVLLTVDEPAAARLVTAELMGLDAVEAAGWPQERGLDDEAWMDELLALRDGLRRTSGLRGLLTDLLDAVASPALAAASAFTVQAAVRRTPILLDGPGAAAAALVARRTGYVANQWWQAAQGESDPLHGRALRSLSLEPVTTLGVRAEDGTAARIGLDVLRVAVGLLE